MVPILIFADNDGMPMLMKHTSRLNDSPCPCIRATIDVRFDVTRYIMSNVGWMLAALVLQQL